jgi:hypothetical protein
MGVRLTPNSLANSTSRKTVPNGFSSVQILSRNALNIGVPVV